MLNGNIGSGTGATMAEAKALAAANCIADLKDFLPPEYKSMEFKRITTTDPHKDILHILTCISLEYGFHKPAYELLETDEKTGDGFVYKCILGTYVTTGKILSCFNSGTYLVELYFGRKLIDNGFKLIFGSFKLFIGTAAKKRVAIRLAALEMYNLIRKKYNAGALRPSTFHLPMETE